MIILLVQLPQELKHVYNELYMIYMRSPEIEIFILY